MIYFCIIYLIIGATLTFLTQSRGLWADTIFTLLWPIYVYDDWRNGRL